MPNYNPRTKKSWAIVLLMMISAQHVMGVPWQEYAARLALKRLPTRKELMLFSAGFFLTTAALYFLHHHLKGPARSAPGSVQRAPAKERETPLLPVLTKEEQRVHKMMDSLKELLKTLTHAIDPSITNILDSTNVQMVTALNSSLYEIINTIALISDNSIRNKLLYDIMPYECQVHQFLLIQKAFREWKHENQLENYRGLLKNITTQLYKVAANIDHYLKISEEEFIRWIELQNSFARVSFLEHLREHYIAHQYDRELSTEKNTFDDAMIKLLLDIIVIVREKEETWQKLQLDIRSKVSGHVVIRSVPDPLQIFVNKVNIEKEKAPVLDQEHRKDISTLIKELDTIYGVGGWPHADHDVLTINEDKIVTAEMILRLDAFYKTQPLFHMQNLKEKLLSLLVFDYRTVDSEAKNFMWCFLRRRLLVQLEILDRASRPLKDYAQELVNALSQLLCHDIERASFVNSFQAGSNIKFLSNNPTSFLIKILDIIYSIPLYKGYSLENSRDFSTCFIERHNLSHRFSINSKEGLIKWFDSDSKDDAIAGYLKQEENALGNIFPRTTQEGALPDSHNDLAVIHNLFQALSPNYDED